MEETDSRKLPSVTITATRLRYDGSLVVSKVSKPFPKDVEIDKKFSMTEIVKANLAGKKPPKIIDSSWQLLQHLGYQDKPVDKVEMKFSAGLKFVVVDKFRRYECKWVNADERD